MQKEMGGSKTSLFSVDAFYNFFWGAKTENAEIPVFEDFYPHYLVVLCLNWS